VECDYRGIKLNFLLNRAFFIHKKKNNLKQLFSSLF